METLHGLEFSFHVYLLQIDKLEEEKGKLQRDLDAANNTIKDKDNKGILHVYFITTFLQNQQNRCRLFTVCYKNI